jgi:arabinofuranan 3-O-arabinosyltransferase
VSVVAGAATSTARDDHGVAGVTLVDGARLRWRAKLLAVCALLTALMFKQAPGLVIADTKLDLTQDPWAFLGRTLHLWEPTEFFGQVQNQAYGYLFPMGPFFGLAHAVGLPGWVTQRLWLGLLVCLAFTGVVRLSGLLGVRSELARVAAGLAFALSPRLLTGLGPTSVEILPMCLAPWVLVPLVAGSRDGDERRAALRSAAVVLCMGGVNAVATAAALPPAVLWLLTRSRGPRRRRLMAWWMVGVALATAWWVLPLLLLGRYSPDFLSNIESANVTTGPTALVETLRGTSAWLAYVTSSYGPALPGGWTLVTNPVVIVDTVVVAAFGLAALAWSGTRERRWMALTAGVGVALVTAGHGGSFSGLFAGDLRDLLDSVLAPLRNVHKFDVVLRLPLVLAGAFLLEHLLRHPVGGRAQVVRRPAVVLTAAAALVGVSMPVIAFTLPAPAPYRSIPGYWQDAAEWLGHRQGTSLLLPASSFGDYYWGSTRDEPLQALADRPWAVRDAVPLTTAGGIRFLDAVDQAVSSGRPSPGLAEYLARAGVRYVVLRNDLEYGRAGSERPLLVHETVVASPGFRPVRHFGPVVGGGNAPGRYVDEGLDVPYRALEVFEVAGWRGAAAVAPRGDALVVAGGPESLLDLASRHWLGGRPAVLAADAAQLPGAAAAPTVLTDGLRRREVFFGRSADNVSQTLTRSDALTAGGAAPDYLATGWEGHQTVAAAVGVRSVTASSSASDAIAVGGARQDRNPWAALDGDLTTAWRSDPGASGRASWTVRFDRARQVPSVQMRTATAPGSATDVRVTTDAGAVTVSAARGGWTDVALSAGRTRRLTISAMPVGTLGAFDLAEVRVDGLRAERTLVMPAGVGRGQPWLVADAGFQRPDCYPLVGTWLCSAAVARGPEEGGSLDRTVVLVAGTYRATVSASPRPGPALDSWLDTDAPVTVSASSTADSGAAGRPGGLVDGDEGTGWRAAPGDRRPWLRIGWPKPVTLHTVQLVRGDTLAASFPSKVELSSGDDRQVVKVGVGGRVALPRPMTVRDLTIRITGVTLASTFDPYARTSDLLPVGFSELRWSGGPVLSPRTDETLQVRCGEGPVLDVAGRLVQTGGPVSYDDVVSGRPVDLPPCEGPGVVALSGGRTTIQARHSAGWDVSSFSLAPTSAEEPVAGLAADGPPGAAATPVRVTSSERGNVQRVRVAARAEPSVLWLRHSHNSGWVASMHGESLEAITIDGWQQGFLLPAGAAGTVAVRFAPDRVYRWGLAVGAAAVLVLLVGACLRPRPGPGRPPTREGGLATVAWLLLLVLLVVATGPWALALGAGAATGALWMTRRRPGFLESALLGLAAAGFGLSGLALALNPWPAGGYAAGSGWSQALCVVSLVAVWVSLAPGAYAGTRDRSLITGDSSSR